MGEKYPLNLEPRRGSVVVAYRASTVSITTEHLRSSMDILVALSPPRRKRQGGVNRVPQALQACILVLSSHSSLVPRLVGVGSHIGRPLTNNQ